MDRIPIYGKADRGGRILLLIAALFLPVCCASSLLFSSTDGDARPTIAATAVTEATVVVRSIQTEPTDLPVSPPATATDSPAGLRVVDSQQVEAALVTPTRILRTPLPASTPTILPTNTTIATATLLPTNTPAATSTPIPQPTATLAPTFTIQPPTATAPLPTATTAAQY